MPIDKNWKAPERKSFPPLPEDIYKVKIADVELVEGKAYKSDDIIEQIKFTFELTEGKFKERKIWKNISPVMSAAKPGMNPSNFNLLYEAVFQKTPYQDQLTEISPEVINSFIGRELRLVIKQSAGEDGFTKNKIDGYLKLKTGDKIAETLGVEPPTSEDDAEDIFANDKDEMEKVNAELAGRSKQEIEDEING